MTGAQNYHHRNNTFGAENGTSQIAKTGPHGITVKIVDGVCP